MNKIFLHVGMAKTGTSALQAFFFQNREILKEDGLTYPLEYGGECKGKYLFSDGNLGNFYSDETMSDEEKVDKIMDLADKYGSILLSTERIWLQTAYEGNANLIKRLKEKCGDKTKIIIIAYLRRQIEYLESQYKQTIKEKKVIESVWDFYNHEQLFKQMDSKYVLSLFEDIVGKENIIVRVYEKEQFIGRSIFSDFLHNVNIVMDERYKNVSNLANISLDNSTIELKKMINRIALDEQLINDCFYYWMTEATSIKKNENSEVRHYETSISIEDKEKFMEKFEEINQYVAERYFSRKNLFLQPYEKPNREISDREIMRDLVFVFGSKMIQMEYNFTVLNKEFELQKQEIESKLQQLQCEKEAKEETIQTLGAEKDELVQQLIDKQEEINSIKNGYSWKITAPLRKIRSFFIKITR